MKSVDLRKSTLIYGLGGLLAKSLLFFINPLLARFLLPEEYGKIAVLMALSSLLIAILPMGLNGSFSRMYFDSLNEEEKSKIAGNIFYGWLAMGALFLIVLSGVIFIYRLQLFEGITFYPYIIATLVASFLFSVAVFLKTYYQVAELPTKTISIEIIDRLLLFGLIFISIIFFDLHLGSWIVGALGSSTILAAISIYQLNKKIHFQFDLKIIQNALFFGAPLILHTASGWVLSLSDRILINSMLSSADVAYYTLSYSIAQSMSLVSQATGNGWIPRITQQFSLGHDTTHLITNYIKVTFLTLVATTLVLTMFSTEVLYLAGGSMYVAKASGILPVLLFGFMIEGFYKVSSVTFHLKKTTTYLPFITIFASILNLGLNIYFIPSFGVFGAAISTVAGFVLLSLLSMIFAKSFFLYRKLFTLIILFSAVSFPISFFCIGLPLFMKSIIAIIIATIVLYYFRRIKQ